MSKEQGRFTLRGLSSVVIVISGLSSFIYADFGSNAPHDPFPLFNARYPHDLLDRRKREMLKGTQEEDAAFKQERINIVVTPFGQNADEAKDALNHNSIPIGDRLGRWDLLATLIGSNPKNKTLTPTLQAAYTTFFASTPASPLETVIDPSKNLGCFSIPVEYRKRGVRFEASAQLVGGFGITAQLGFADICQTARAFNNLNTGATYVPPITTVTSTSVDTNLMELFPTIAQELKLDIDGFHDMSVEDFRAFLYWRHEFTVNKDRPTYPLFLCIPHIAIGGVAATGKDRNPHKAFGVSFGNNGHSGVCAKGGIDLDFADTVEIGFEVGVSAFNEKDVCDMPLPNHELQTGIFPFSTNVRVKPGATWHLGVSLGAYHFLERLSFSSQYVFVDHRPDSIALIKPDSAFKPAILEKISNWRSQFFNIGLSYDLSPNLCLAGLWQAPITERLSYRSTSILLSFQATF